MSSDGIRNRLKKRNEELKEELKTRHLWLYNWLIEHNINLDDLAKYTKNIAAALIMTTNQLNGVPDPAPVPPPQQPEPEVEPVDISEPDPAEEKRIAKANFVWSLYGNMILAIAEKYEVDPQLIFATIMTESGGNQYSYRYEPRINDASYGLGQVLYSSAIGLGFTGKAEELYEPIKAIDLIARYHQRTKKNYGELSPEEMTTVYNTGSLYKRPYPGHLKKFSTWYSLYPGPKELASAGT